VFLLWGAVSQLVASDFVSNPSNSEKIDKERMRLILTGREKFWSSGDEVLIAMLKSDPGIDETIREYSGMTAMKFRNHWQRMAFSGRGKMPKVFNSLEELVAYVQTHEGAIGIIPAGSKPTPLKKVDLGMYLRNGASPVLFASQSP